MSKFLAEKANQIYDREVGYFCLVLTQYSLKSNIPEKLTRANLSRKLHFAVHLLGKSCLLVPQLVSSSYHFRFALLRFSFVLPKCFLLPMISAVPNQF